MSLPDIKHKLDIKILRSVLSCHGCDFKSGESHCLVRLRIAIPAKAGISPNPLSICHSRTGGNLPIFK